MLEPKESKTKKERSSKWQVKPERLVSSFRLTAMTRRERHTNVHVAVHVVARRQ